MPLTDAHFNGCSAPALCGCVGGILSEPAYDPQPPIASPPPNPTPVCDPLRIGFSWVQYGAGFGASDISQYDDADPIVFREWTYGQTTLNPAGFTATGLDVSYFYDEFGTWPLSLFIRTASGQVRTLATTTPIVTPYDNTTTLLHLVYSTTPTGGLPFCQSAPTL